MTVQDIKMGAGYSSRDTWMQWPKRLGGGGGEREGAGGRREAEEGVGE